MKTFQVFSRHQRRLFLVLPLLVLPFLSLAFWALGGGKNTGIAHAFPHGLNLQLPEPRLKEGQQPDKLTLYKEGSRHSRQQSSDRAGLLQRLWRQGNTSRDSIARKPLQGLPLTAGGELPLSPESYASPTSASREAAIRNRLSQLNAFVNRDVSDSKPGRSLSAHPAGKTEQFRQDIARLENLMQDMDGRSALPDPEVRQLEGMLDRILDIQHPERVKARELQQVQQSSPQVVPVQPLPRLVPVTLLEPSPGGTITHPPDTHLPAASQQLPPPGQTGHAFYGITTRPPAPVLPAGFLKATIQEKQKVSTGSTVSMRLQQDAYLGNRLLPAGTLLHGTCRIQGERLFITVSSVPAGNELLPVALAAYDLDGIEGIYVPGALVDEAASQGADRLIHQRLPAPGPSLGTQAAAASLEVARNIFSRKTRRVKVTLPAGHQLLLLDRQT